MLVDAKNPISMNMGNGGGGSFSPWKGNEKKRNKDEALLDGDRFEHTVGEELAEVKLYRQRNLWKELNPVVAAQRALSSRVWTLLNTANLPFIPLAVQLPLP